MEFVPGLELSRRFHRQAVAPLLAARFPGLAYAAARLDGGSELFGFDTARSVDHDWGPRLQLFLDPDDAARTGPAVDAALRAGLPRSFLGYPTHFADTGSAELGVLTPPAPGEPLRHGVHVTTLARWLPRRLGFDPRGGVGTLDWLATPAQRLAEVTAGEVFHDGLGGELTEVRARLAWYPDDVWRHVLAAQWRRVAQEEAFPGRCVEAGDELGATVLVARLVRDLMRLCLLLHRRYPPYPKWLGSAFAALPGVGEVSAALGAALATDRPWPRREAALCQAYTLLGAETNATGLAEPVPATVRRYFDRPYLVLGADRFAAALRHAVTDPQLRDLPLLGAVDQYVDSTDVLMDAARARQVALGALSAPQAVPAGPSRSPSRG